MVEIGDIEIRRWIDAKGFTKPTARAYTGALKTLVNFFHDRKRKRIRQRGKTPTTWPLSIVRALFNKAAAIEPDAVPALVLLFQCGVRPHEVLRSTWKMIDLKARLVRLPAEVTKTGEARQVTIPDNAVEWLAPYIGKATDKLVAGATHGNSETALNRWRRNLMLALKIEDWPKDVARHTFATNHFHLHDNAALTMTELGHFQNPDMFRRHYKGAPVDKADAAEYFQIRPGTEGALQVNFAAAAVG